MGTCEYVGPPGTGVERNVRRDCRWPRVLLVLTYGVCERVYVVWQLRGTPCSQGHSCLPAFIFFLSLDTVPWGSLPGSLCSIHHVHLSSWLIGSRPSLALLSKTPTADLLLPPGFLRFPALTTICNYIVCFLDECLSPPGIEAPSKGGLGDPAYCCSPCS